MHELQRLLALETSPVALAFCDAPPAGLRRVLTAGPAGCSYWKRAAEGEAFYTAADDHKNCPVGAHTHGVLLSPDESRGLEGLVNTMVGLEYLRAEEVPSIPTRKTPFAFAAYSPLESATFAPDVVLLRANARQMMLLAEAAQSAGVAGSTPAMGRPTCAVIPESLASARTAASFGCVGNRVYTGLADHEAYYAIPGAALDAIVARLRVVARANDELAKFHQGRAAALRSAPSART